jgi:hypothetical protein
MVINVETLLSDDDVTVLGPPSTIDVAVDIGPEGKRGSQIFVGVGNPNIVVIGQTPELNDLFINASPGADYGYLYQYISQPGGNSWVEILRINPVIYSENHLASFSSGASSIVIPISNIITSSGSPLTAANFNIQYSVVNSKPVSSSISIPPLSGDNLVINLEALEYISGDWEPLDGNKTIHFFISIVASS